MEEVSTSLCRCHSLMHLNHIVRRQFLPDRSRDKITQWQHNRRLVQDHTPIYTLSQCNLAYIIITRNLTLINLPHSPTLQPNIHQHTTTGTP